MFTGIVEELGKVAALEKHEAGARLTISAQLVTEDISNGDSIAVNGVCLTALNVTPNTFAADVSPETLDRTTLGTLHHGSPVNLERAVTARNPPRRPSCPRPYRRSGNIFVRCPERRFLHRQHRLSNKSR
jgi:riboflavin synthase